MCTQRWRLRDECEDQPETRGLTSTAASTAACAARISLGRLRAREGAVRAIATGETQLDRGGTTEERVGCRDRARA